MYITITYTKGAVNHKLIIMVYNFFKSQRNSIYKEVDSCTADLPIFLISVMQTLSI